MIALKLIMGPHHKDVKFPPSHFAFFRKDIWRVLQRSHPESSMVNEPTTALCPNLKSFQR